MKALALAAVVLVLLAPSALPVAAAAHVDGSREYLVNFSDDPSLLGRLAERGCRVLRVFDLFGIALLGCPRSVESLGLEGVVPNLEVTKADVDLRVIGSLDEMGGYEGSYTLYWSWAVSRVAADMVWGYLGATGEGIVAAILDTGIDPEHPLLVDRLITVNPGDPTYPGGWIEFDRLGRPVCTRPRDLDGHGTWTSSILAGGDTSRYIFGIAPSVKLMVANVLPSGRGTFAQVLAGLEWVLRPYDCRKNYLNVPRPLVVSMSLGAAGYYDEVFLPAIRSLLEAGIVVVAAIGNAGPYLTANPGNVWGVIGVGATDFNDEIAWFSSYEEVVWPSPPKEWPFKGYYPERYRKPDVAAPGVKVAGAYPGGYLAVGSGTSASTPVVAGVAALVAGYLRQRGLSGVKLVEAVYDILTSTALPLDHPGAGRGRIRAYLAVSSAAEASVEHVSVSVSPPSARPGDRVRVVAGVPTGRLVDVYISGVKVFSGSYPAAGVTVTVPETHGEGNIITVVSTDGRSYGETLVSVGPAVVVGDMTSGQLHDVKIVGLGIIDSVTVYAAGNILATGRANLRGTYTVKLLPPYVSEVRPLTLVASSPTAYLSVLVYVKPPEVYDSLERAVGELRESLKAESGRIDKLALSLEELRLGLERISEELRKSLTLERERIDKLSAALEGLRLSVESLAANVSKALDSVAGLDLRVAGLDLRVASVEGEVSRLRLDLGDARSRLEGVEESVVNLRESYSRVSAGLDQLTAFVREELDRVSRNLGQLAAAVDGLSIASTAALILALASLVSLVVALRTLRRR